MGAGNYCTVARKEIDTNLKQSTSSEVFVVFGQGHFCGLLRLCFDLGAVLLVNCCFSRSEDGRFDKHQVCVVDESAEEPHERLLELVVALRGDVVVLQVLLAVEGNLLGFHLAVLHVDLVANEHDRDCLANSGKILVPLGHVGVGDASAHVKHDDTAVATNVVTISQTSQLFLASSVPNVEKHLAVVGEEGHGMHLHSQRGDVLLLELASQVTLHERGLADTAVSNQNELELGNLNLINHLQKVSPDSVETNSSSLSLLSEPALGSYGENRRGWQSQFKFA